MNTTSNPNSAQVDMKNESVVLVRHGDADALQLVSTPVEMPKRNEVLIRVEAAGVAFADVLMRRGLYPHSRKLPFVPGYDVVGVVEHAGSQVKNLNIGDRVAALTQYGGYSRYLHTQAWRCVKFQHDVDPAEAVALILNYITAYQMLHRSIEVLPGETILVHGAAGGVGTALTQLGVRAGLKVYGTASKQKHTVVRSNGGIPVDYRREDFVERVLTLTGDGVDAAFDPIGGNHWVRSYRSLRLGGNLVLYGASAALQKGERNPASLLPGAMKLGALLFMPDGRRMVSYFAPNAIGQNPNAYRHDLKHLLQLLADGEIKPCISERLPLEDAPKAHQMLEAGDATGKIVLIP